MLVGVGVGVGVGGTCVAVGVGVLVGGICVAVGVGVLVGGICVLVESVFDWPELPHDMGNKNKVAVMNSKQIGTIFTLVNCVPI